MSTINLTACDVCGEIQPPDIGAGLWAPRGWFIIITDLRSRPRRYEVCSTACLEIQASRLNGLPEGMSELPSVEPATPFNLARPAGTDGTEHDGVA